MIPNFAWIFWINFREIKINLTDYKKYKSHHSAVPPINTYEHLDKFNQKFFLNFENILTNWNLRFITTKDSLYYWIANIKDPKDPKDPKFELDLEFVLNILSIDAIGAAHRSDVVRFFLLKYYGGIWMDATTIVLEDPYNLIGSYDFVLPYVSEEAGLKQVYASNLPKKGSLHRLNFLENIDYSMMQYPFIPENYYIASIPHHFIIVDVLKQLHQTWAPILKLVDDKITVEVVNAQLAHYLYSITYNHLFTFKDETMKANPRHLDFWIQASYLFGYIQLYHAIQNSACQIKAVLDNCYKSRLEKQNLWNKGWKEWTNQWCLPLSSMNNTNMSPNTCMNLQLGCRNKHNEQILLFSATYLRLFRHGARPAKSILFAQQDIGVDPRHPSVHLSDEFFRIMQRRVATARKAKIEQSSVELASWESEGFIDDILIKLEKEGLPKSQQRQKFIKKLVSNKISFIKVSSIQVRNKKSKELLNIMLELMLTKDLDTRDSDLDSEYSIASPPKSPPRMLSATPQLPSRSQTISPKKQRNFAGDLYRKIKRNKSKNKKNNRKIKRKTKRKN